MLSTEILNGLALCHKLGFPVHRSKRECESEETIFPIDLSYTPRISQNSMWSIQHIYLLIFIRVKE